MDVDFLTGNWGLNTGFLRERFLGVKEEAARDEFSRLCSRIRCHCNTMNRTLKLWGLSLGQMRRLKPESIVIDLEP